MIVTSTSVSQPMQTISVKEASRRSWDVTVVGAGPAGAVAARQLARQGHQTLLVERAKLPRWKVCGCCLNAAALEVLERVGLRDRIEGLAKSSLQHWRLATPYGQVSCDMPRGLALSRECFDSALVSETIEAGADYLDGAAASVIEPRGERWRICLRTGSELAEVDARVLVAADGLKSGLLSRVRGFEPLVDAHSWIGAAATVPAGQGDGHALSPDTIYMTCGPDGYVGRVVLESGQIEIAAAVDPVAIGRFDTMADLIAKILTDAHGFADDCVRRVHFRGTPELSRRRRRLAGERLFLIGDACGYTEPFAGEGMAWALASGVLVAPLVTQALRHWDPSLIPQWQSLHHHRIRKRQRLGRLLTRSLRYRSCTKIMTAVLNRQPRLAASFMRRINAPFDLQSVFAEAR